MCLENGVKAAGCLRTRNVVLISNLDIDWLFEMFKF